MQNFKKDSLVFEGKHDLPISADVIFKQDGTKKPIVIFCHGYKGFKDWGAWHLMGEKIAEAGYFFLKFNFSHNGTDQENPTEFREIEAFGENNYEKELDDLQTVIDRVLMENFAYSSVVDAENVNLLGHSRGGGIVIIKSAEEERISKVITLASVSDFSNRFPKGDKLEKWRERGVSYIRNGRTGRQLPHHFQFFRNYRDNEDRFNLKNACKKLEIPHLIVHGSNDSTVSIGESGNLFEWSTAPKLLLVENADHVFCTEHPWEKEELPKEFNYAIKGILKFLDAKSEDLIAEYGDTDEDDD